VDDCHILYITLHKAHQSVLENMNGAKVRAREKNCSTIFVLNAFNFFGTFNKHFARSGYHPMHPYFGNALDLGLYSTQN
jgi:hypothetical protein